MTELHNKSIVGKGNVWYEMSYDDAIAQRMQREARAKEKKQGVEEDSDRDYDDEDDDDDDIDFNLLGDFGVDLANRPVVNGTESAGLSDEGMFGN